MDSQTTAPQTPADRAGMVGQDTKQAASDVASTAGQEAKRTTREAKDQTRQLMSQARSELTDQAASQQARAATGLRQLADQLGSMADGAGQDGMARDLVDDVARRAHDAAAWLDQRDPGSLLQEARDFARRRPGTFLAVAAGLGVLGGRLSRSLVEEAKDSSSSTDVSTTYPTETGQVAPMGTGSLAGTGTYDTGMPSATTPTYGTTSSVPVTPGASDPYSTVPSDDLPGVHRASQPISPDGTPTPIDREGRLTTLEDEIMTRGER